MQESPSHAGVVFEDVVEFLISSGFCFGVVSGGGGCCY